MNVDNAIILQDPNGKFPRHIRSLRERRDDLAQLGLFEMKQDQFAYTRLGRIAHYIATEVSPKRAAYRTVKRLSDYLTYHGGIVQVRQVTEAEVEGHIKTLIGMGLIEPDRTYFKAPAWRLC